VIIFIRQWLFYTRRRHKQKGIDIELLQTIRNVL